MQHARTIRAAPGQDVAAWAEALVGGVWQGQGVMLKDDGERLVVAATVLGQRVVIKQWPYRSIKRRVQAMFGRTPALRHWHGARLLAEAGVASAPTLAVVRGEGHEWLVMEAIAGDSLLECLADESLGVRERHALARSVGRLVAGLTTRQVFNRDMKPSNILVTRIGDREADLVVIDCGGVRRQRGARGRYRMLASLLIEPVGVGLSPPSTLIMRGLTAFCDAWLESILGRAVDRRRAQDRRVRAHIRLATMNRVALAFANHGDLRPLINPLLEMARESK